MSFRIQNFPLQLLPDIQPDIRAAVIYPGHEVCQGSRFAEECIRGYERKGIGRPLRERFDFSLRVIETFICPEICGAFCSKDFQVDDKDCSADFMIGAGFLNCNF